MGILALRLIHVVVGVFWVGSVIFIAAFLAPAVRAAGAGGGAVMGQLMQRLKLHRYLTASTWLTILSGAGLAWLLAGANALEWLFIGGGRIFGIGTVLAVVATAIGLSVNAPTAAKISQLAASIQGSGRPPTPDEQARMQALQVRLGRAAVLVAALLSLATAAMAVARYVSWP